MRLSRCSQIRHFGVHSIAAPSGYVGNDADLEANPDVFGNVHQMSDTAHVAQLVGIALAYVALVTLLVGIVVWTVRHQWRTEKDDPVAIP
jgi:hypothetical protein